MEKTKRPPYLRLVAPPPESRPAEPPVAGQMQLFPADAPTLLLIVDMGFIEESELLSVLCDAPPRWLIDLRPLPRFDFGTLNRARVFRIFEQNRIRYLDLCGKLRIYSRQDASFLSGRVAAEISRILVDARAALEPGKVTVLVDTDDLAKAMRVALPAQIQPAPRGGWETSVFTPRSARSWVREG